VHFCFTHDEETGFYGIVNVVEELTQLSIKPAMALVGEPTEMRIIDSHKGGCEYTTHFHGLPGHGSQPDRGVSAIDYATRYMTRLMEVREELKARAPKYSRYDPPWTTLQVGRIEGGTARNVVAEQCSIDWETRPISKADQEFVKAQMIDYAETVLLPEMRSVYPDARINLDIIGEFEGFEPQVENQARDLISRLTGANSINAGSFGTEASFFQSLGIDVVVCGPGSIEQAHKVDEFITTDQLDLSLQLLEKIAGELRA
jgi:acetylornithine deacetylase